MTMRLVEGITHAIGSDKFPAPQGTLMATLIRGLLSFNLDWQSVLVGVFLAVTMELCGVKSLSFAVGAYLPLSVYGYFQNGGSRCLAIQHRTHAEHDLGIQLLP